MRDVLKNGAARFLLGIMVKHQSHYMRHTKPFWATGCSATVLKEMQFLGFRIESLFLVVVFTSDKFLMAKN